jgi:hypothetical protein
MGVYIKGMNKPESCNDCIFNHDWEECLVKNGKEFDSAEFVYSSCPLQPIDDEQVEKTQNELIEAWTVFQSVFKDEKL